MMVREAPAVAPPHAYGWKHLWKKRLVTWSRWLHIYLSMVSFAILFFFAVTGLTVNHIDWFANQQKTFVYKGTVPHAWLRPANGKEVAKLEIVEQLRKAHGIKAALNDFRVDDAQCAVSFKGPGYTADTFIDRDAGSYEVTETKVISTAEKSISSFHPGPVSRPLCRSLMTAPQPIRVSVTS